MNYFYYSTTVTNIFKAYNLGISLPLAYALYTCENAENYEWSHFVFNTN